MDGEERQEVELLRGQVDPHAGPGHLAVGEVEVQGACVELVDPVPRPPGAAMTHGSWRRARASRRAS